MNILYNSQPRDFGSRLDGKMRIFMCCVQSGETCVDENDVRTRTKHTIF